MTRNRFGGVLAVLLALLPLAAGYLTNLVTSSFSWAMFAALVGLAVAIAVLAWYAHGSTTNGPAPGGRRNTVKQVAAGGTIDGSQIFASMGSDIVEKAGRGGQIENSSIRSRGGRVHRIARRGRIANSEIVDD